MKLSLTGPGRSGAAARRGGERGFTLIETAAALLILMVAGLGAASLFSYSITNNNSTKDRELALAVAQKRMEWLRSIPFNPSTRAVAYHFPTAANPVGGGLAATAAAGVTETAVSGGRTYTVVTIITNFGGAADADATRKDITVTVTPVGTAAVLGRVQLVMQRAAVNTGSN